MQPSRSDVAFSSSIVVLSDVSRARIDQGSGSRPRFDARLHQPKIRKPSAV
jgi:hypothetical protein